MEKLNEVEKKEALFDYEIQETIPLIRYLNEMEKDFKKIGYAPPVNFDWWEFYLKVYEKKNISNQEYENFKSYINTVFTFLGEVNFYIQQQFESIGKTEFLKTMEK